MLQLMQVTLTPPRAAHVARRLDQDLKWTNDRIYVMREIEAADELGFTDPDNPNYRPVQLVLKPSIARLVWRLAKEVPA